MKFTVKELQWDSDFFNLKVGEIIYSENCGKGTFLDFDLIYVVSDEDFQLELDHFETSFEETKVVFSKTLQYQDKISAPIFALQDQNIDIQTLYALAFESGKNSRFLLDKRFDESYFKKLYIAWVDNSVNKKFADDVLVYWEENTVKGFVTYKIKDNVACVGLIAVDPGFQGKGIGATLLKYLENLIYEKGFRQVSIPTQMANIAACQFYTKQGYIIENKKYIKHYWKK